ncbi:LOW QUALITY PROTEIN: hypothetical protein U9M48_013001 [Paspalum notatum var. saurae]|uniref:Integrase catalytic domain-containing protein n=1 Tax=Paspalum notatum var. saurae TaxID=547442 RepID=A0AAQ3SZH8_PASNO
MEIHYHPGKANVVADALSRKSYANMALGFMMPHELCEEFERLSLDFLHHTTAAAFEEKPTLEQEIREHQKDDEKLQEIRELLKLGKAPHFREDEQGTLCYKNRICVPNVDSIRKLILSEAHDTAYFIHPGSTKMYYDLKERFWWYGMKRVMAEYVVICDTCQRVKAEYQRPADLLQPLKVPEWKWEEITMDFIVNLPRTQKGYNSIWVVVDRLTKVAHYIPVNTTYSGAKLAELYISRIVCLHGVPKRIISDRGSQFTSRFWEQLHNSLDTKLRFSTGYHPQTDGQIERTNQILEDMLRACAIQYGTSWDKCLPYAKFSYNNSYQASLKKSPFEALYGERCRTPLFWNQTSEKQVFGPDIIQDAEQQLRIENLRAAQSRQRSYAGVRRRDLSFKVDDHVYLKVSPMRGIRRFNMKGKLAPRYIGPFKVQEKKGEVAYRLELPPSLSGVHDVFHVSQLKRCLRVPEEQAPLEGLEVQEDLTYTEHPAKILDTSERSTRKEDQDVPFEFDFGFKKENRKKKGEEANHRANSLAASPLRPARAPAWAGPADRQAQPSSAPLSLPLTGGTRLSSPTSGCSSPSASRLRICQAQALELPVAFNFRRRTLKVSRAAALKFTTVGRLSGQLTPCHHYRTSRKPLCQFLGLGATPRRRFAYTDRRHPHPLAAGFPRRISAAPETLTLIRLLSSKSNLQKPPSSKE